MHQAAETSQSTTEVVAGVGTLLSQFNTDELGLLTGSQNLQLLSDIRILEARLAGIRSVVVQHVAETGAADDVAAMSLRSWLQHHERLTSQQAAQMVKSADRLDSRRVVRQGMIDGRVSPAQADAITLTVQRQGNGFSNTAHDQAAARVVGYCDQFNSVELEALTKKELECADPEWAEHVEAAAIEREHRIAQQTRFLSFTNDGCGSVHIRGKLPTTEADLLKVQLEALESLNRRTVLEARDPYVPVETKHTRMADALIEFSRKIAAGEIAPKHGGDRPTLMITIAAEDLAAGRTGAAILPDGHQLTSDELAVACCDANIIRIVTGGPSGILDVGRLQRLVTPDIRRALAIRDQGCIFPGCDRLPADCDAHHIIPWQQGGPTSLINLIFVCRHHHGYIEPRHKDPRDNWTVDYDAFGLPILIPPERVDPTRKPIRHNRFALSA